MIRATAIAAILAISPAAALRFVAPPTADQIQTGYADAQDYYVQKKEAAKRDLYPSFVAIEQFLKPVLDEEEMARRKVENEGLAHHCAARVLDKPATYKGGILDFYKREVVTSTCRSRARWVLENVPEIESFGDAVDYVAEEGDLVKQLRELPEVEGANAFPWGSKARVNSQDQNAIVICTVDSLENGYSGVSSKRA